MSTSTTNYWDLIDRWLDLREKYPITLEMAAQNFIGINYMNRSKSIKSFKENLKKGKVIYSDLANELERLRRLNDYKANTVPTTVKIDRARGQWIKKMRASSEEIGYFIYTVISGMGFPFREGYLIVNFEGGIDPEFKAELWSYIFEERKIGSPLKPDWGNLSSDSYGRYITMRVGDNPLPYIISTAILIQYAKYLGQLRSEAPGDDLSMVVLTVGKKILNEMQVFTRINRIVEHWFDDVLRSGGDEPSGFGRFVSSLYIGDEKYRDKSATLLNKFLHSFLMGHVSGELLDKLVRGVCKGC